MPHPMAATPNTHRPMMVMVTNRVEEEKEDEEAGEGDTQLVVVLMPVRTDGSNQYHNIIKQYMLVLWNYW